jgi:hypothetical protein
MAALAELTDTISVAADAISTNFELQHRSNSTPFDRRTCNESAINDVSGGRTGETAGTVDARCDRCMLLLTGTTRRTRDVDRYAVYHQRVRI